MVEVKYSNSSQEALIYSSIRLCVMVYVVRLNLKGFFIKYRLYCTLCKDFDWWMAKVLNRTQFVVLSACIIHVLHHALYVWHPFGNKPGFPILPVGVTRFNWHRFLPQQYFATFYPMFALYSPLLSTSILSTPSLITIWKSLLAL